MKRKRTSSKLLSKPLTVSSARVVGPTQIINTRAGLRLRSFASVEDAVAQGVDRGLAQRAFRLAGGGVTTQDIRCNVPVFNGNNVTCEQTDRCARKGGECHVFAGAPGGDPLEDLGPGPVPWKAGLIYVCACVEIIPQPGLPNPSITAARVSAKKRLRTKG